MDQIDLQLAGTAFLRDAVDLEPLRLGEIIDVVDHRAEFIDRGHRIGLPGGGRTARAAHHRLDLMRGIEVAGDEKEFHLGCDDRFPPLVAVKLHHALEHVARGIGHRFAVAVEGIVDDLKRPVRRPGRGGGGIHVGAQDHVFFDETLIARRFAPFAGDRLVKDAVGEVEIFLPREFRGGHGLAACDPGQIGNDTFHFVEAFAIEVLPCRCGEFIHPVGHQGLSFFRFSLKNPAMRSATVALSMGASSNALASCNW